MSQILWPSKMVSHNMILLYNAGTSSRIPRIMKQISSFDFYSKKRNKVRNTIKMSINDLRKLIILSSEKVHKKHPGKHCRTTLHKKEVFFILCIEVKHTSKGSKQQKHPHFFHPFKKHNGRNHFCCKNDTNW